MKAAVYTKYGPPEVLQVQEAPRPFPKSGEVLIQIHAATVNRTDCGFRSAKYFVSRLVTGLAKPKQIIMGSEFAGQIVEIGAGVSEFKVGDKVFGFDDVHGGAHAEYMTEPAAGPIATMPAHFGYEQMAPAGEGATYALNIIQAAGIQSAQKVLVYGASGAIGSAAVQILKSLGAEVTAVCGTSSVELAKSLGADQAISYQTQDFTQLPDRFHFVLDAVGKTSYGVCRRLLAPSGKYCSTELGRGGQNPLLAVWFTLTGSRRVIFPVPRIDKAKIEHIKRLVAAGVYRPVIDRIYPLADIVAAARYVETGQKIGNVVLKLR